MRKLFFLYFVILWGCMDRSDKGLTSFVNPFIGTDGHGHTYPGASMPFGMVQLSPDTRKDHWDGCSGYHYSDNTIMGFSHTHLSGTGVGDYGDIRFMPITGPLQIRPGSEDDPETGYRSSFSHQNETATPGYYQVFLEDYRINAEMTVTNRCGFHRYTFPKSDEAYIIIDLKESIVTEKNLDLYIHVINDREIRGYRRSSGWAADQVVYFHALFSKPFEHYGIARNGTISEGLEETEGNDIQAFVRFHTGLDEKIMVKVGISPVSMEGAKRNLDAELYHWKFNRVKSQADETWEHELGKIKVKGSDRNDLVKFYTALYHAFLAPNLFMDVDGQYRGHDGNIHLAEDFTVYTVFSLWDTYRALHPLLSFLQPDRTVDFIRTFLDIYEKGGLLPVWELAGNETFCMIGYHAVPVIVDTYLKGLEGFDPELAYRAARNSAAQDHFGLEFYKRYGYIPAEKEGESVSKTLEYAYDDWCIALMAKALGKEDDYRYFIRRAQYYKNLFDPETGFIRGKRNGMFTQPFDPAEVNFMLTEANTWQYTFHVPQDIDGLKVLMGGDTGFEEKLDEMFASQTGVTGRQQADISGLIGQYAHGNEPSHHVAYLYNFIGKPYKTQKLVRQIMRDLYGADPSGLCGNEDCGQMSAWFIFSAMGFYPVTPAIGYYVLGSPLFEEVVIYPDNGKKFTIRSEFNNTSNIYVQSVMLNGESYEKSYLAHSDLTKGGLLTFEMGSRPNLLWAVENINRPKAAIEEHLITPVPYFSAVSGSFQTEALVSIHHIDPEVDIYYLPGNKPADAGSIPYTSPMALYRSTILNAMAFSEVTGPSLSTTAYFHKINHNWMVSIKNPYSPQYTGGGDMALIDGQRGGKNFRTGSWQGYHGVDLEAVVDMGRSRHISRISASFLQDEHSWIFFPEEVEFSVSSRPYDFRTVAIIKNDVPADYPGAIIKEFTKDGMRTSGRFVKVIAKNRSVCPPWHVGAGDKAWIFIDEVMIE